MTPLAEIRAAKKRALKMGAYSSWVPAFDSHPLAASIDNHTAIIDAEIEKAAPDFLAVLLWIETMARKINAYCDEMMVSNDAAAQYWLERFLWRCDVVANLDCTK